MTKWAIFSNVVMRTVFICWNLTLIQSVFFCFFFSKIPCTKTPEVSILWIPMISDKETMDWLQTTLDQIMRGSIKNSWRRICKTSNTEWVSIKSLWTISQKTKWLEVQTLSNCLKHSNLKIKNESSKRRIAWYVTRSSRKRTVCVSKLGLGLCFKTCKSFIRQPFQRVNCLTSMRNERPLFLPRTQRRVTDWKIELSQQTFVHKPGPTSIVWGILLVPPEVLK